MKNELSGIHLIMPMAGGGLRFLNKGFDCPKPLIEIHGKPFFYWAVQSVVKFTKVLDITFVVLHEHVERFNIDEKVKKFYPDAKILIIPKVLNGVVLTCMEGSKSIKDNRPVIFNDCDHMFKSTELYNYLRLGNLNDFDAGLLTFESDLPQYSYAKLNEGGRVICTAEKQVISNRAICGAYYFKNVDIFVNAVKHYINTCQYSELFLSGVYNVLIEKGMIIGNFNTDYHISFGTPEEYDIARDFSEFGDLE